MEQFYTLVTDIGKAKIANATALQKKLELSKIVLGDSNGSYYEPTENQNKLKNQVWKGEITDKFIDKENKNWIVVQTIIPSTIGGFTIREAGIVDSDGDLVVIAKYPETYKPKMSDGSTKDITINLILEVSNVENVTLKVDPTIIFATKEDIKNVEKQIRNINVPVQSINGKTGAVELKAADITTEKGTNLEELSSQYEDCVNKIGNIKDLKTTNKDNLVSALNEVFTSADNGKKSIYNSIVGKKVTPKSKDFKDLKSAIDNIKLGQGTAQPSHVLKNFTFTNDTGVVQEGNIPVMGSKEITPSTYVQELGKGYYNSIKIKPVNKDNIPNIFPNLKPENIADGVDIGGIVGTAPKIIKKSETFTLKDMKKNFTVEIKLPNKVEKEDGIPTYDDTSTYRLYVYLFAKTDNANYQFSNDVTFYHWGTNKHLMVESSNKDEKFTNFGNKSYHLDFKERTSYAVYDLAAYISFKLHKGYSIIEISLYNFPEKNEKIIEAKLNYNLEYIPHL
ncbi:phage tail protein [Clostridium botulinum D/C]|nr:phage tail protein [Clostridium botulinum]MCD3234262.1 phage tail protein [Clostridium botulinum D/C]MCD3240320.1 phage tail protein [Clostridium botulinum D/C]MCD3267681.1 phage tail protein [Clostridium botulinum D/C]MCD3306152.1 phage tail protein [Clostridium botulinum D/C]MCD3314862.1 phage tail protein [Clostridium botulinum D/C]